MSWWANTKFGVSAFDPQETKRVWLLWGKGMGVSRWEFIGGLCFRKSVISPKPMVGVCVVGFERKFYPTCINRGPGKRYVRIGLLNSISPSLLNSLAP